MTSQEWTTRGTRVTDAEVLNSLQRILEEESALIVEHRFLKGSRAPYRFISDDYTTLEAYLRKAPAGDSFCLWRFEECCRNENIACSGKVPNAAGLVPVGGAY
jgi:hypothetical protein